MIFELEETVSQNARMKVVGVGGGGGNALNRMVDEGLQGVEFISVNTDAQALLNNKADVKVQIGKKLTRGLGAGARPEIGRQAIEENGDEVLHSLQGADMVFVTCGMGGGTGTGASPIIAQMARDLGALTIGIVTKPFLFEGRKRMRQADMGIAEMRKHVDTMVVVPNERLLAVVGKGIPFQDALKRADEVLLHATQGISSLITVTGIVNVDFADVRTVMQNGGAAIMGTGMGRGENRAMEAVQQAISSPLLHNNSITGAPGVLLNITPGRRERARDPPVPPAGRGVGGGPGAPQPLPRRRRAHRRRPGVGVSGGLAVAAAPHRARHRGGRRVQRLPRRPRPPRDGLRRAGARRGDGARLRRLPRGGEELARASPASRLGVRLPPPQDRERGEAGPRGAPPRAA